MACFYSATLAWNPTAVDNSLLAQKQADRQKWLKERSIKLTAKQMAAVKQAQDVTALLVGLGSAIDERASPKGEPLAPEAPYMQPTEERRRSGSHYTPRSLTEPIVRHALKPAFERIGPEAGPEAVLALRVCDPACGSGAFLVEACRQLGSRLEQAWDMHEAERPTIPPDEDAATHARRLVAQRCLYGVDRNPMAVDLARLSLWLATLAREHEFSFLDHALKAGDSLVGLSRKEIQAVNWDASKPGLPLFRSLIEKAVGKALEGREAIRNAGDDVALAIQNARHRRVEDEVEPARIVGDAVITAFFSADKPRAREAKRQDIESWLAAEMQPDWDRLRGAAKIFHVERGWRPFHWEIEFPEVFARDNPGFDAIVGNPPFAGKNTISAASGPIYLPWLQALHAGAHGNADLVAHFFRRAFGLLRAGGSFGLIATNTIGQGDTRETGLATILRAGGSIYRAVKRHEWPNEGAAVVVSIVHVKKGPERSSPVLSGRPVSRISAYLVPGDFDDSPRQLQANARRAFQGSIVLGMGFTFDDTAAAKGEAEPIAEMKRLIRENPRNAERIKPYIGGEEVNTSSTHAPHRFVIDFFDRPLGRRVELPLWRSMTARERDRCLTRGLVPSDYPDEVAEDWPDLIEIVRRRVKPDRDKQNREALRVRWWQYAEKRPGLYSTIKPLGRVLSLSRVTEHIGFASLENGMVYADRLVIFAEEASSAFPVLQSRVHEVWARTFSATMEDRLLYAPSDCFETFPFPTGNVALEVAGQSYHDNRVALMVEADEGMTRTYNRFHDEAERRLPIQRLRELHDEMDRAVLRAYGWDDLAETLRPVFLTPETEDDHTYQGRYFWPAEERDLVLSRLLALNAERHAEEVAAGIAPAKTMRGKADNEEVRDADDD